ncbi:GNAT family N-acetyltransferase [Euzebyella saccharophila]|uniref:GNAT family N-acetyltransferase n=1 Tax=Euzebyella saccharophila TaxID=679664 RepID=A0ABV8JR16_9FLAO|nr:GNAT family N-acetyltransferase [Euzebyella saccharophila]
MFKIIRAEREHLEDVAPLFDAYRVFYEQESDQVKALEFLTERFLNDESVIFMAYDNDKAVGFTQLYTTFSSVSLKTAYILNDLFVNPEYRKKGVGEALLLQAQKLCGEKKFKGISLETAHDNPAQRLYEKLGWEKDSGYFHYFWTSKQVTN